MVKQGCILHGEQDKAAALLASLWRLPGRRNLSRRSLGQSAEQGVVLTLRGTCSVMRVEAEERGTLSATCKGTGNLDKQPTLMK